MGISRASVHRVLKASKLMLVSDGNEPTDVPLAPPDSGPHCTTS
jgi:hypothetical protein